MSTQVSEMLDKQFNENPNRRSEIRALRTLIVEANNLGMPLTFAEIVHELATAIYG